MSSLSQFREQIQKVREDAHVDLDVPRMEGWAVRYRPVSAATMERIGKEAKRSKDQSGLDANAAGLAEAFVGMYRTDEPDQLYSLEAIAEEFGIDGAPLDAVKALYGTDGDLVSTAIAVLQFSGFNNDELLEHIRPT